MTYPKPYSIYLKTQLTRKGDMGGIYGIYSENGKETGNYYIIGLYKDYLGKLSPFELFDC